MRRALAISLLLLGGCRANSQPKAATHEHSLPAKPCPSVVVVTVEYPGAAPAEVEAAVVLPVEAALVGLPAVKTVASRAGEGRAVVSVEADGDAADILAQVRAAVDGITAFPEDAARPIVAAQATRGFHLVVVDAQHELASADTIHGAPQRTLEVSADEARLRAVNLDLKALESALTTGVATPGAKRTEALGQLVVQRTAAGQPIYLRDVAKIVDTVAPVPQAYRGDQRVVLGRFAARGDAEAEAPNVPGQLDVFAPTTCDSGAPSWVSVTATLPPGSPPAESARLGQRLAAELRDAEPRAVVLVGDSANARATASAGTQLKLLAPAGADAERAARRLVDALHQTPGLALVAVSGIPSAIALDVAHEEHETRSRAVQAMSELGGSTDGVLLAAASGEGAPELSAELTAPGRALGLTSADIARQIRTQMHGVEVGRLQLGQEEVLVRLLPAELSPSLADITVQTPTGAAVNLGNVARIELGRGVGAITRRDGMRATPVVVFGPNAAREVERLIQAAEATGVSVHRRSPTMHRCSGCSSTSQSGLARLLGLPAQP